MNNLLNKGLTVASIFALALLWSCGDEDTETPTAAPSLTVVTTVNGDASTDDPIEAEPGDSIGFDISINAEGGFNTFSATTSVDGGAETAFGEIINRNDLSVEVGTQIVTIPAFSTILSSDLVGSTITFSFDGVDEEGKTSTSTVDVQVTSPTARNYATVLLAAPLQSKDAKSFFSSSDGMIYSPNEVLSSFDPLSASIDFGYYFGATNEASLASPAVFNTIAGLDEQVENWGAKNATKMRTTTMTSAQFTEASTYADIDEEFEAGTDANGSVTNLSTGAVAAFETVDGVRGLALVKSITEGDGENGKITLDILVQQEASN